MGMCCVYSSAPVYSRTHPTSDALKMEQHAFSARYVQCVSRTRRGIGILPVNGGRGPVTRSFPNHSPWPTEPPADYHPPPESVPAASTPSAASSTRSSAPKAARGPVWKHTHGRPGGHGSAVAAAAARRRAPWVSTNTSSREGPRSAASGWAPAWGLGCTPASTDSSVGNPLVASHDAVRWQGPGPPAAPESGDSSGPA